MIPKSGKSPSDSRKSVGIQEFAALARSSLNGKLHFLKKFSCLFFNLFFIFLLWIGFSSYDLVLFFQVSLRPSGIM